MIEDTREVWVMGQAGGGTVPVLFQRRHFTVTELEHVTVLRAELGLGFEGHAPCGCGLPAGWEGGMRAVLRLVDVKSG